jgi:hypothetical protein
VEAAEMIRRIPSSRRRNEWHKRFKEGVENVEDDERIGHPRSHRTDENDEKVRNMAPSNRCFKYQSYDCAAEFIQRNSQTNFK